MAADGSGAFTHLDIDPARARWNDLFALLQRGVYCPLDSQCSVYDYLTAHLGIDPEYVQDKIATVFADGSVVDDLDATTIGPGSTMTLSAAMPGLVGATLRRGGYYAAMRSEISWKPGSQVRAVQCPENSIRLKLFNTIMKDVGPSLLTRGVLVRSEDAASFLASWCPELDPASADQWVSLAVVSP